MEEVINLIINNGIGVGSLVFLMYFISTTMKQITETLKAIELTLSAMKESLTNLTTRVDDIEHRLNEGLK